MSIVSTAPPSAPPAPAIATAPKPGALKTLKGFALGATAACMATTVTEPFDVVKTRLQLQGEHRTPLSLPSTTSPSPRLHLYRTTADAFTTMIRTEGPRSLYKGLLPAYAFQVAMNGTRLGLYDPVRGWVQRTVFKGQEEQQVWLSALTAGAMCGAVGAAVGSPLFMVKVRLQAYVREAAATAAAGKGSGVVVVGAQHDEVRRGFLSALGHVARTEGVRGLWRGVDVGVVRFSTGSAVQLSTYELLKPRVRRIMGSAPNPTVDALAAACAQVAVVTAIDPMDVVYSRMLNQKTSTSGTPLYRNSIHCLVATVRNEGVRALYKGYIPHLARAGPQGVLTLTFLDALKRWMGMGVPTPTGRGK
ncbi:mitochondrial carrier [Gonapodya prolifera JEL478]|uniref:Mitochondrial carrier n=1 Tax=Gonapodya prolifera (strain JEL478) TaxID=1344416 RepID=A0A139AV51_GONPJ|nr:mitochondrial carrier [Gonapodya prolifera JEL478]|eukprot:KXS20579.1 mitochondrial carrier [Gonapodya prolifera JEL478]